MQEGLLITVVDVDPEYLGIEIHAASGRFSGSTRIYAGLTELSEFAHRIAGFPTSSVDERNYEFGSRDRGMAGGYCSLRLRCIDSVGHAKVEVAIEDDEDRHGLRSAEFSFPVVAADMDEFTTSLRVVERDQNGAAILHAAVSAH
jgi:hypothetical protein